jgi:catechol-2,3-dioxygenase
MSDFGDYEPEDAWDADDDAIDMATNLLRRLDLLDQSQPNRDLDKMIGQIEQRVGAYRRIREQLNARDLLRLDQLTEDLPTLRERARHG